MTPSTALERFNSRYIPSVDSGCWLWQGYLTRGYGRFRVSGALVSAHRFAYLQFVGEIPDDMHVCHQCDVPNCVNPTHLFLGSAADNVHDAMKKGRRRYWYGERDQCKYGHVYAEVGYTFANGGRVCKQCARDRFNRWYALHGRKR